MQLYVFRLSSTYGILTDLSQDTETVIHSDSDFATVAYLRVPRASLVDKIASANEAIHPPDLLTEEFNDIHNDLVNVSETVTHPSSLEIRSYYEPLKFVKTALSTSTRIGSWVTVANVHADLDTGRNLTLEEETVACFQSLQGMHSRRK